MNGVYRPYRLPRQATNRSNRGLRRASCLLVLLCAAGGGCSAPSRSATSFSQDRLQDLAGQSQAAVDSTLGFLKDRQRINTLFARSRTQYRNGDLKGARKTLRAIRQIDPYCRNVFEFEARIALDMGDADAYLALLRETLAANPQSARIQNDVGQRLVEAGEASDGIHALERATELESRNARYAQDLAASFRRQGEVAAASQVLVRAIANNPAESSLRLALARLLEDSAQWKAAAHCYDTLLAFNPNQPHLQRQRAHCLSKIADAPILADGLEDYIDQSRIEVSLQDYIDRGDRCLGLNKYDQAQQIFDALSDRVSGQLVEVEVLRGICALNRGALDQAQAILVNAITHWPNDPQLHQLVERSRISRAPDQTLVSVNLR